VPTLHTLKKTIVNGIVSEKRAWRLWSVEKKQRCANIAIPTRSRNKFVWCETGNHHQWQWWKGILVRTVRRQNGAHWFRREILVQSFRFNKRTITLSLNEKWKEDSIYHSCRCIKIPAGDKKCVEMMITDKLVMPYYDREESPAEKSVSWLVR